MGYFDMTLLGTNFVLKKGIQVLVALLILLIILSLRAPMLSKTYIYSVFREMAKVQMMWKTRGWQEIEGEHFRVRYQKVDEGIAPLVMETAEKDYQPLIEEFAYKPREKVLIVVYPTRQSLSKSFGWASDESAMGVYWAGVIRVLSPQQWIESEDYDGMKTVFQRRGPMAHEFTHLIVDYMTRGNYSRWFTEGIALYHEFKLSGEVEEDYQSSIGGKQIYPFNRMDREFDALPDQSLAYRQSYEAVNYLIEKHGEAKLWEVLIRLSAGETMDQSFRNALGIDLDEFEAEFKTWVSLE